MSKLHISDSLALPIDAVTERFALLAVSGAGKSNAAVVMAEEMFRLGLPWVAVDPKGDWWGIRSSVDGKKPGLPVLLFGAIGRKRKNKPPPDVPLEDTAGKVIADLVVDERISCILDMSGFSEASKIRFLIDFGSQLFERNEEPLHVFYDECDDYLPQKPFKEQTRLLHVFTKMLKQGRGFGLGASLISQRYAAVNKNALTQCTTLFALRNTSPQDRDAIEGWVKEKGGAHLEIVESLPSLENGEAWVWSPQFLRKTERFMFRQRETFDSGATPKVGTKRIQPKTVADIDLGAVQERMLETIERAKQEDPKQLRKEIARLKGELGKKQPVENIHSESKRVEVPVLKDGQLKRAERLLDRIENLVVGVEGLSTVLTKDALHPIREALQKTSNVQRPTPNVERKTAVISRPRVPPPAPVQRRNAEQPAGGDSPDAPSGGLRRILVALAQRPQGLTARQIGVRAGLSSKGGTFSTYLSRARTNDWIEGDKNGIRVTQAGIDALGSFDPLPTGHGLLDHWLGEFGDSGAAKILRELAAVYPNSLTKAEVAERAGISAAGGTFSTYVSRLRSLELIQGKSELKASGEFFE